MKKFILTLFLVLCSFSHTNAQRFPITVVPQVNPPAPVNFHSYADATTLNSPLRIQLVLSDITVANEQIRLKVYFEGNGINFESRDVVVGASPLFIDGGIPLTLTNTQLAPYFEFQNLQGINPNIYGRTIPEGSYQFCFEIFDFTTGNRLSSKTCASTYIFKNEPPLLNLPLNKVNIESKEVDNIVFQWTPRQINVSNVEYELSIVEIWDDVVDPQTAFLSVPPIFETTTRATSFVYGPAQPLLLAEKRYAWRVRAKALQGAEEIGLFRNEGKSEIFWFSRTSPCATPPTIYAEPKGISKINVFWDEDPTVYQEYTIAYRDANKPNAEWFTIRTNSGWATVWDLKPGTTYEYKVKGKCKYQYSEYSEPQEITTANTQDETANYNCGIVPDEVAITNREPNDNLQVGDRITAGDFVVTITEITGGSDRITGKGYVKVPYLKSARFGVTFKNILINTDNQLAEGEIVTLYDAKFGEGASMTVDVNINISEGITGDQGGFGRIGEVPFVIQSITIDRNGAYAITGTNGESATVSGGRDVQIRDANGTVWSVGDDGTVTKGEVAEGGAVTEDGTQGLTDGEVSQISATGVVIKFKESGKYYFDTLPEGDSDDLKGHYKTLAMAGGESYPIPYKAISDIKGDDFITAEATFSDDSITPGDIVFKTKEGTKVPATWDGNIATLSLKRKSGYLIEQVLATVKPKETDGKYTIAGAFNLVHLGVPKAQGINVVIVPINNAPVNEEDLKEKINEIYNKAGVSFTITVADRLQIPESVWDIEKNDNELNAGDSGLLSHYSPEEIAINEYFKAKRDYKKETYYIFATDLKAMNSDTKEINGFMPLKRQFGFIFKGATNDAVTAAHELGHGVFGLEHPFTEYNIAEGATNFLMDYSDDTVLNHMDWKKMHAPGFKLYWFQGDEAGEAGIARYPLTPNWEPFNYKESIDYIRFEGKTNSANGSVYGIKKDGKNYIWNGTNYAYNEEILPVHIITKYARSSILQIELYWYGDTCKDDKKYRTSWGYIKDKKGFDVDEVFNNGFFDSLTAEIKLHGNIGCGGRDTGNDRYEDKCLGQNLATINDQKKELKAFVLTITEQTTKSKIVDLIDDVGLCVTKELTYNDIKKLLEILIKGNEFDEDIGEAIVKLINSIEIKKHNDFYNDLLAKNNYEVLNKLLTELENYFFTFWNDDNSNHFIETLAYITSNLKSDTEKWNVINAIINNKYDDINEYLTVTEKVREGIKSAITEILLSINENSKIQDKVPAISKLFTGMLVPYCKNLGDYEIVFKVAKKRNENREAFAIFTQSEKKQIIDRGVTYNHKGGLSWVLPLDFQYYRGGSSSGIRFARDEYAWPKLAAQEFNNFKYNRKDIFNKELTNSTNSKQFIEIFLQHYRVFLETGLNPYRKNFWDVYEKNLSLLDEKKNVNVVLNHINTAENAKSLESVAEKVRLKLFKKMLADTSINDKSIDPVYKEIHNDALMKLALSFKLRRRGVINAVEGVGLLKISKVLSGDRLSKFLAWFGQYIAESGGVEKLTDADVQRFEESFKGNKIIKPVLELESDIFKFRNFNGKINEDNKVIVDSNPIPYKKIVMVHVANDFTFLGEKIKKGTVLIMPIIQTFAMSNSNTNTVAEKSAWFSADVLSFVIGVGGARVLFKTGGKIIKKTILSADIVGSGLGAVETALNEGAVSDEVRVKMQLLSMMLSIPDLFQNVNKIDGLITKTDNAIDKLGGISAASKSILKRKLNSLKSPALRAENIMEKIRQARPNCK